VISTNEKREPKKGNDVDELEKRGIELYPAPDAYERSAGDWVLLENLRK